MTASRTGSSPWLWKLGGFNRRDDHPRLQHTLEQLSVAAFLFAPRSGAILAVNVKAIALTEWGRDELMARSPAEIVAPPAAAEALEQIHLLHPGGAALGTTRHLTNVPLHTRSGRLVYADLRLSAFDDEERKEVLVLMLATPVEERLAQEREASQLGRVLEGLEHMLDLMASPTETTLNEAVGIAQQMFRADAAGLYRAIASPPSMRLAHAQGVPAEFPRGLGPSEVQSLESPLHWGSGQRAEGFLYRAARAAGWTTLLAHPVGEPPSIVGALFIAYRSGNSPASYAPSLLSLTARQVHSLLMQIARSAELDNARRLAVRLSTHFATLNSQIEEGVVLITGEGLIDEINAPAARMLGYRSEEVTGWRFDDVLISNGRLIEAVRLCLTGVGLDALEDELRRRNGEAFPVTVRLRPLAAPEGGCALTLRDLSEKRASEINREHLDQLAYAGQATQSFAHEVRSPLNNIAMGVQFLAARLPSDEGLQPSKDDVRQALNKIQVECTRLSSLMNDMLAWAKPVDPKLEPTDLGALLQRLLNRWSAKIAQRNVRLVFQASEAALSTTRPLVLADARQLEQVFVNLVDNALQAMPAGGQLTVTLQAAARNGAGQAVEVRVVDTGPGIPEEARRRIFDPYFTTKPNGTGLGLAICKRLVTIHRGAIAVESFPGVGTIFTVTLPQFDSEAVRAELMAPPPDSG
jgi:two-component system nitrogen regulation sensor histidine kinase GlnL